LDPSVSRQHSFFLFRGQNVEEAMILGSDYPLAGRKVPQRETHAVLGRWSGGRCSKARVYKLENSRPKPGRMEETLEGGQGPPGCSTVGERERERLSMLSCPRRIESSCMAVSSSASFGVVSCVSAFTVAVYLGFAIVQTLEHLT